MFGRSEDKYKKNPKGLRTAWPKDANADCIRVGRDPKRKFVDACKREGLHPSREATDFLRAWSSDLGESLPAFGRLCRERGLKPSEELDKLLCKYIEQTVMRPALGSQPKNDLLGAGRSRVVMGGLPSLGKRR
jgi:hypothetical protein